MDFTCWIFKCWHMYFELWMWCSSSSEKKWSYPLEATFSSSTICDFDLEDEASVLRIKVFQQLSWFYHILLFFVHLIIKNQFKKIIVRFIIGIIWSLLQLYK
jgi:hypothetical protein